MHKEILVKLSLCLLVSSGCLYSYFDKQNELTQMKIKLPALEKQIRALRDETKRLRYEVDQFENPTHLIEVARSPEFGHLKHPLLKEVFTVSEGMMASGAP